MILLTAIATPVQTTAGLEPAFDLATYYPLLIFLAAVILFALGALGMVHMPFLKPSKMTVVKSMPYESGMDPVGDARMHFDVKFYLIAILFLVFDVELLFLYPWATIAYSDAADPHWREVFGKIVFVEILVFLFTLGIAYVYAWRKGVFQWR